MVESLEAGEGPHCSGELLAMLADRMTGDILELDERIDELEGQIIEGGGQETCNDQFSGTAAEDIGSGLWWSAVTVTTVGCGDKSPRTVGGGAVAMV